MKRHMTLAVTLLTAFAAPIGASANDQELYDPAPPADSAFVRVINAMDATTTAVVGPATFKDVAKESISAYSVVKGGKYNVKAGDVSEDVQVEAGKYYSISIAPEAGKPTINRFEDAEIKNPAKSVIYFYNLSNAKTASLVAPKQKADIIANVATGQSLSRDVNALTLDLAVTANGDEVSRLKGVELKRRTGYSVVLFGEDDNLNTVAAESVVKK